MMNPFQPIDTNQGSNLATRQPGPNKAANNERNHFQNTTNFSKAANNPKDDIQKLQAPKDAAVSNGRKMTMSVAVRSPNIMYPLRNAVDMVDKSCEAPSISETTKESPPSPMGTAAQEIEAKYVSDFALDHHAAFRKQELLTSITPSYQSRQPHLTDENRAKVIDWITYLHTSFRFSNVTLHLAVSLLDRCLDATLVALEKLQLVGAACFWIASKYEERRLPMHHLLHACAGLYTRQEFIVTEKIILSALHCRVSLPTANTFLGVFLAMAKLDNDTKNLAHYILDGTLSSYKLLQYLPSELAAAAFLIACHRTGKNGFIQNLAMHTDYEAFAILPVASAIVEKERA
jgi:Cyclin, N-terminal domain/Cyclin, C-terminal domain